MEEEVEAQQLIEPVAKPLTETLTLVYNGRRELALHNGTFDKQLKQQWRGVKQRSEFMDSIRSVLTEA